MASSQRRADGGEVSDLAVVVDQVSKRFLLHRDRPRSLKESLTSRRRVPAEEFWALRDVSFEVPKGSLFGVIGSNGSGKSSLLRLMAGIYRPTSGAVTAHGRVSVLLELGAGFHPALSGRENIFLNAAVLGVPKAEVAERVDQIIEFSGLEEFIDSPVKVYSSGMYVRLGFSVAVHVDPEILLVDEVVAVGDEEFQLRCFSHLDALRSQGVTIVLVSHDLGMMRGTCDRLAWLDQGRLAAIGEPSEVVNAYLDTIDAEALSAAGFQMQAPGDSEPLIGITDVQFMTPNGERPAVFATGDPLVARVSYRARAPVEAPVFSLEFYDHGNLMLAGPRSHIEQVEGEGYVDFRLERIPFRTGTYHVNAAVFNTLTTQLYHRRIREFWLRVAGEPDPGAQGLLDVGGRWMLGGN